MIDAIHCGVEIELGVKRLDDGRWGASYILDPKGSREKFATTTGSFKTNDLARLEALKEARLTIERTRRTG